jgi:hypothetical protein
MMQMTTFDERKWQLLLRLQSRLGKFGHKGTRSRWTAEEEEKTQINTNLNQESIGHGQRVMRNDVQAVLLSRHHHYQELESPCD